MKNIFVPTDFSNCSTYAVELAMGLAELTNATLHLFTSMDNPKVDGPMNCELVESSSEGSAFKHNVDLLFEDWRREATVRDIKIKTTCSGGSLLSGIQSYVADNPIDLIVMGSHGQTINSNLFMGTNTQKVIRSIHLPVLIIKERLQEYKFKNVVYASDFKEEEKASFQAFLNIIKYFKPDVIHLLSINTIGWLLPPYSEMEDRMEAFKKMCGDAKCKTHFYHNKSLEDGIRSFSEAIEADLVVVSNHFRDPVRRIFSGSNVEGLVNHSSLPVLTIDFEESFILK